MTAKIKAREIADFAVQHSGYYRDIEFAELEKYVSKHIEYGTIYVLRDIKGIAAVARWNILQNREVLHLIDLIIRPDIRSLRMLRLIAINIWKLNPQVRHFYYDREKRGERVSYGYELKHWLKLEGDKSSWAEKAQHHR